MLNEQEEKALIGLLYNHVSFGTTLQVFGEAGAENDRINTLRSALDTLLTKYNLLDKLAPENLLMLGLKENLSKEQLSDWIAQETNKHLQLRAKHFLRIFDATS